MVSVGALKPRRLVRHLDAGLFLEHFLVSAVLALLVIRFYLHLTGYPKLGGGGLHIAHMLWGGALMLVALVVLLVFTVRSMQHAAAIVGGIGFGTFIDELGKFITSDHDYFFQPTIALLYAIFVLLFLVFKRLGGQHGLSEEEYLVNALELLKAAVLDKTDRTKKECALLLSQASHLDSPLVSALKEALRQIDALPASEPRLPARIFGRLHFDHERLCLVRWLPKAIMGVFLVHGAAFTVLSLATVVAVIHPDVNFTIEDVGTTFETLGDFVASLVSSVMIIAGALNFARSRLTAYQWFKRATLVSIFLVQLFAFYTHELGALTGLLLDIVFLISIEFMIREEQGAAARHSLGSGSRHRPGDEQGA